MSAALAYAETVPEEETCPWCGGTRIVKLFEMWDHGHEFMLDTCCPAALEEISAGIADDPAWGCDLLRRLGAEAHAGHRLRRVADDGVGGLLLDYHLQVRPVAFTAARAFVARHHSHCNPPVVIWTTCISTGTPDSAGVPCRQMERSNGRIWDPARGCH